MAFRKHPLRERIRHRSLVVIRDDESIQPRERSFQAPDKLFFHRAAQGRATLAVHAHDLLMPRDDARLYCGDARGVRHQPLHRDARRRQTGADDAARFVLARHAKRQDRCPERRQVRSDVPCPAEHLALALKIHHGNRSFRRKPRGPAPHVAVQHEITNDGDPPTTKTTQDWREFSLLHFLVDRQTPAAHGFLLCGYMKMIIEPEGTLAETIGPGNFARKQLTMATPPQNPCDWRKARTTTAGSRCSPSTS